jgi:hypothetical protein
VEYKGFPVPNEVSDHEKAGDGGGMAQRILNFRWLISLQRNPFVFWETAYGPNLLGHMVGPKTDLNSMNKKKYFYPAGISTV